MSVTVVPVVVKVPGTDQKNLAERQEVLKNLRKHPGRLENGTTKKARILRMVLKY